MEGNEMRIDMNKMEKWIEIINIYTHKWTKFLFISTEWRIGFSCNNSCDFEAQLSISLSSSQPQLVHNWCYCVNAAIFHEFTYFFTCSTKDPSVGCLLYELRVKIRKCAVCPPYSMSLGHMCTLWLFPW